MHFDGKIPNGSLYVGWVVAKSGDPVDDKDVKAKYEANILAHSGIRLIGRPFHCDLLEPELFKGYDPKRKGFNQEVELTHDLEPMEVYEEEAANPNSSTATSATPGLSRLANGLSSSRRVHAPRSEGCVVQPPRRRPIANRVGRWATWYSCRHHCSNQSHCCGLWFALRRPLSWLVLTILMSFISTCTLQRSEPALAAVWAVWNPCLPCSVTGA